jgi:peptide/nickel transport system substrate-binding protein
MAMSRIARPSVRIAALAVAGLTALAACSSGSAKSGGGNNNTTPSTTLGGAFGTIPAPATGAQHAGTITWAEPPGAAPTWILPLVTSAAFSVNDTSNFSSELWRPLYWFQNGVEPSQTPSMSLANNPVWSNGDTTATITLKSNYKWSDGQPVSSRDVLFFFDEVKAAIAEDPGNWGPYNPGLGIPDEVASVTTPNASTVVFTMKKAVNPGWFLDDELTTVNPMPAHAWAKASANGPLLDFTVPANAKKIWDFLNKQSMSLSTYATNPLWRVVDGPYLLTSFDSSTGAFTMIPNTAYGGPHAAKVSTLQAVPFTSDTAEFDAVRADSIDIGYLPLDDIKQVKLVESGGYNVFGYPDFGFAYITYNFADTTGNFNHIIGQLYIRQALAHLEDEQGYIKAFFGGAGGPAYGPVPSVPHSPYTPADAMTDPYPYSIPDAISLLKNHGWTVNTSGTDTCARAGTGPTDCGAGIPAGTKLAFNLIYASSPAAIGEQCTAFASAAASAGITIHLSTATYNYIITYYDDPVPQSKPYINKWAMEDFGGFTDSTYPTQLGVFNGPGSLNEGDYDNPTADALINASVTSGNPAAVKAEASFLTANQPGLFQPNPDGIVVWKDNISGPVASFASLTQFALNPEFWWFTS